MRFGIKKIVAVALAAVLSLALPVVSMAANHYGNFYLPFQAPMVSEDSGYIEVLGEIDGNLAPLVYTWFFYGGTDQHPVGSSNMHVKIYNDQITFVPGGELTNVAIFLLNDAHSAGSLLYSGTANTSGLTYGLGSLPNEHPYTLKGFHVYGNVSRVEDYGSFSGYDSFSVGYGVQSNGVNDLSQIVRLLNELIASVGSNGSSLVQGDISAIKSTLTTISSNLSNIYSRLGTSLSNDTRIISLLTSLDKSTSDILTAVNSFNSGALNGANSSLSGALGNLDKIQSGADADLENALGNMTNPDLSGSMQGITFVTSSITMFWNALGTFQVVVLAVFAIVVFNFISRYRGG